MTYEEFKKKMVKLSEARKIAMEDNDFDADEQIEHALSNSIIFFLNSSYVIFIFLSISCGCLYYNITFQFKK